MAELRSCSRHNPIHMKTTAIASKLAIDATKKLPGEGFKRPWPPLIRMDAAVKAKIDSLFEK